MKSRKQYILACLLWMTFLFSSAQVNSQLGPQKGMKGFVEMIGGIGLGLQSTARATLAGTYGYQFNPNIFSGAGFAYDFNDKIKIVYVDARATMNQKISPFADLKMGLNIDNSRFYVFPSVGCRVGLNNGMALNFGVGMDFTQTWHYDAVPNIGHNSVTKVRTMVDNYSFCVKAALEI